MMERMFRLVLETNDFDDKVCYKNDEFYHSNQNINAQSNERNPQTIIVDRYLIYQL